MKTILITGAAGDIGTHLRRELAGTYALRLSDIRPIKKLVAGETSVPGDIASMRDMLRATKGVDAIVHLGGSRRKALGGDPARQHHWLLQRVRSRARMVSSASYCHQQSRRGGFYRRDETIDHRVYPKPDSRYGLSKVFQRTTRFALRGEIWDAGVLHAYRERQPGASGQATSPSGCPLRDLASWFGSVWTILAFASKSSTGVSANQRSWYDNSNAQQPFYRPQDDSEPYASAILAKHVDDAEPRVEQYQSGTFVVGELGGSLTSQFRPRQGMRRRSVIRRNQRFIETKRRRA
jgi:uronate dehydrogenase